MALSGFILTDREKYLVEKMINDVKMAVFRANLYILDGTIVYKNDSIKDKL